MILKGIIEQTFGGMLIFRGYASLKDLANISKTDSYQREVDTTRIENIIDFLRNGTFRFFPELIFSMQFNDSDAIYSIREGANKVFTDEIRLVKGKFSFQENFEKKSSVKVISLEFTNSNRKYLSRIDGNHRLSAVDEILSSENTDSDSHSLKQTIGNITVPFSVLLQGKSDEATKYETAFFYLINSQAKPLTTEQNLKAILTNPNFTDPEKEKLLGSNALNIEKLAEEIEGCEYSEIKKIIKNEIYSFCVAFFKLFIEPQPFEKIKRSLLYIDTQYYENDKLKSNPNINILLSLLYFRINDESNYFRFKDWIVGNQLFNIQEASPVSIIDFYKNTHKKGPYNVFVAMPYVSHKQVNEYNKLFKEVLKEIQEKEKVELELIPIMRFRGASQRIDQRLIKKIKECDIFIADLTSCNDNVIYEIGLAEGNNKPMILIKAENDVIKVPFDKNEEYVQSAGKVPFDMDKLQYIPYSSTGYYNDIKSIIKNNLPEILKVKYNEL